MLRDRPWLIDGLVVLVGALTFGLCRLWRDPFGALAHRLLRADLITISLATSAVAALTAGLMSVVVVFAWQSEGERWVTLRHVGGRPLRANALAPIAGAFAAAFGAIGAAISAAMRAEGLAIAVGATTLTLLLHASSRAVWLLSKLIQVRAAEDRDAVNRYQPRRRAEAHMGLYVTEPDDTAPSRADDVLRVPTY